MFHNFNDAVFWHLSNPASNAASRRRSKTGPGGIRAGSHTPAAVPVPAVTHAAEEWGGGCGIASRTRSPRRPAAVLATVMVAVAAALLAGTLHESGAGQAVVLNPVSYPLVGGIWAVDLEVLEGGGLRVAAAGGTEFGRDVEFAGMRSGDGTFISPAVEGGVLHFGDVAAGTWTLEVRVQTDGPHRLRFEMGGQSHYADNTAAFANVTSATPDGIYGAGATVDVRVTFTDSVSLEEFGIRDGSTDASPFDELDGATSVTTVTIPSNGMDRHYALVAAYDDSGLQIIDVTDPESPIAVAAIADGDADVNGVRFDRLGDASSVTTTQIGPNHYALVASFLNDGLQIIDITNPASPTAVASVTDNSTANPTVYTELDGALSVTAITIDSNHYALVASYFDDGLQIINITTPASPSAVAAITDCETSCSAADYPTLQGATSVTTATIPSNGTNRHYALVASYFDHGLQIIDITTPASPSPVAAVTDGDTDGSGGVFDRLLGANSVTTTTTRVNGTDRHYALVASPDDDGLQIIDITAPASPTAVASMVDGMTYPELKGAYSVTTATIPVGGAGRHYALVASYDDHGLQIIDITAPASPTAVAAVTYGDFDGSGGVFDNLHNAASVTTVTIPSNGTDRHYALVASDFDDGLQIIDITAPASPTATASVTDSKSFDALDGATSVTTVTIPAGGADRHYALVAAYSVGGFQIIDITDPESPIAVRSVIDSQDADRLKLDGASSVATAKIGPDGAERHYALIASHLDHGVHIFDITIPELFIDVAEMTDCETFCTATDYPTLEGATSVTTTKIGSNHYALVASQGDDGLQIIDITDPESPRPVASITDGSTDRSGGTFDELDGAFSVTTTQIGPAGAERHYALIASITDNGVQIIDITTPASPTAAASITDSTPENPTNYTELEGASSVTTTKIGSNHYALVASLFDDALQIIDITDPSRPSAAASITDSTRENPTNYMELDGATSVTTTTKIGPDGAERHYALATSQYDDGLQIIDITDPSRPTAVAAITDSTPENPTNYPELEGAYSVTTTSIGPAGAERHYALVASLFDDALQMIDVTDPAGPFNPLLPSVELDLAGDRRATYAGLQDGGRSMTFEYVVRPDDWTTDLAYSGTDALSLGATTLTHTENSADLSVLELPAPGSAHSLSHNKDIILVSPYVTSETPDGTYFPGEIVDVRVEFAEPVRLETFGLRDGVLVDPVSVATATMTVDGADRHYALVASYENDGLQIIDVTDPAGPAVVSGVTDCETGCTAADYHMLEGATSVATATMPVGGSDRHYALVASYEDDGLQIIDITNPASPSAVAHVTDGDDDGHGGTFGELNGARSVTTVQIGPSHYALVASELDHGLQIIDITAPASPSAVSGVTDCETGCTAADYHMLEGATSVATATMPVSGSDRHYALVASYLDNGLQIIDITNPASPSAVAHVTDGDTDVHSGTFDELEGARSVATIRIGSSHYALVASEVDDGLQIIDITDPASPAAVSGVTDCETGCSTTDYPTLKGAYSVTTATIPVGGADRHYALVASYEDDGIQIIDITDPASPAAVAHVADSTTSHPTNYPELDGARSVAAVQIGPNHYALVASNDGLQIVDVTHPARPSNPLLPYVRLGLAGDRRATYVGLHDGGKSMAFEYVARPGDGTADLSYSGTDALNFGRNVLADASDSTDLSEVGLLPPGSPRSLSHNKDIILVSADVTSATPDGIYGAGATVDVRVTFTDSVSLEEFGIRDGGTDASPFDELDGATSVTTVTIPSNGTDRYYALVASYHDSGLQIIDVTDPESPTAVAAIADGDADVNGVRFDRLGDASSVTTTQIGPNHYALVASFLNDGLQIIDITNPASPTAVASVTDNSTANPTVYTELDGALSVTAITIDSNHYALVASYFDDGLQIINITTPASPSAVAAITDCETSCSAADYPTLQGATSVTTATIPSNGTNRHYALVASYFDHGLQIIDITTPASPSPVAAVTDGDTDGSGGVFDRLLGANSVTTTTTRVNGTDRHYALVASPDDDGLQIIDITAPASPTAVASMVDGMTYPELKGAYSVTTATIPVGGAGRHYALVASYDDHGLQIIDITAPASPTAVAAVTYGDFDGSGGVFDNLHHAASVTTVTIPSNGTDRHYALVASDFDDGLQIIDITAPASPTATASVTDSKSFDALDGATSVTTVTIPAGGADRHYALVAAYSVGGFQIIDITDPESPIAVRSVIDSQDADRLKLDGASSVATAKIGPDGAERHYALVASYRDDGVQTFDITIPEIFIDVAEMTDCETFCTATDYPTLDGATSVTTTQIGSNHYALVASQRDDGLQIIDITDPESPRPVASITDGSTDRSGGTFDELHGAESVTTTQIGPAGAERHYALVASSGDDGVQIIDITDPSRPTATASITDSTPENPTDYTELNGATSVTTTKIGSNHYALVASLFDAGIQIIDITDPSRPSAAASITDGGSYPALNGAYSVTTTKIGPAGAERHYALVASQYDNGIQIIDITDPSRPSAVAAITDSTPSHPTNYPELEGATSVTTTQIGPAGAERHYALVASLNDDALQMIDVTDPAGPFNPLLPSVELDLAGDRRAAYTGLQDGGRSLAFEYVVRPGDWTTDLAYSGTGALYLGHNILTYAENSADLSVLELPAPKTPHSLSHNKDIILVSPYVTSETPDGTYFPGEIVDVRVEFAEPVRLETFGLRGGAFGVLGDPYHVATATIPSNGMDRHYALVASYEDDGLQIIDVTDPAGPAVASGVTDCETGCTAADYHMLEGASSVATAIIPSNGMDRHYALVASYEDDGLQIINVTNPESPSAVAHVTDGDTDGNGGTFGELEGASSVTAVRMGSNHYALVASYEDDGLQIIDVTDPESPAAVSGVTDCETGCTAADYHMLEGATSVATATMTAGGADRHYALVASYHDDGLQIIDVTDPESPSAVAHVTDGDTDVRGGTFDELEGARSVAAIRIGSSHYALVASEVDDGLQIIDITTPAIPVAVSGVTDCEAGCTAADYHMLDGAYSVTTVTIPVGGADRHYALVASYEDDGLQIIDITTPASPAAVAHVTDSTTSHPTNYQELDGARSVAAARIGPNHYALVASNDGLQVVDVTHPVRPFNPLFPYVRLGLAGDRRATYVGLHDGGKTMAFEYLVKPGDWSTDLAYSDIDALDFGRNALADAGDSTDLSSLGLPEPGSRHSLSHNKDIILVSANVTSATPDGTYGPGETVDVRIQFPEPVSLGAFEIRDGRSDGHGGTFDELERASSVATATIPVNGADRHYALIASRGDSGLQIIDITDPENPTAVSSVTDSPEYPELQGAKSVTTATIPSGGQDRHYALVASEVDDGLQIINITNPASPTAVAHVTDGGTDGNGGTFDELEGASSVTTTKIGSSHYALVASTADHGLQIIDITDPANPSAVSSVTHGTEYASLEAAEDVATVTMSSGGADMHYALVASYTRGIQIINITDPANPSDPVSVFGSNYPTLDGAISVAIATIPSNGTDMHYALVASSLDHGIQIINITDPSSPSAVSSVTDSPEYPELQGAESVTTATIPSGGQDRHYALVASYDDGGLQIIDITTPASPSAVSGVTDSPAYPTLDGATFVTTTKIGPDGAERHYALVASDDNYGLQVIDVTDPARPFNPLGPYVMLDLAGDRRATYAGTHDGDRSMAFEYAVKPGDWTRDLAYSGMDALNLGRNTLADAGDSTDLSGMRLPVPGSANSLSHDKDIVLAFVDVTSDTPDGTYGPGGVVDVRVTFAEPVGLETFGIRDGGSGGALGVLDDPISVTTATIESGGADRHYALAVSFADDGLQIIDVTDPASPTAVAAITDCAANCTAADYAVLDGAASVATAVIPSNGVDRHYAMVASYEDDGIQIIDITTPASPSAVAGVTDCETGCTAADYSALGGARSVTTATIPVGGADRHYALVASYDDGGLQIIDITTPASPTAVAAITDGGTYPALGGARSVTTAVIPANGMDRHYALVASYDDGGGLQIIDITTPASPSAVAHVTDGGTYPALGGARSVATAVIPSNGMDRHYALVASYDDGGLQIIDITTPASPSAVAHVTDGGTDGNGGTFGELEGASSVTTAVIPSNGMDRHYALVASFIDGGLQIIDITTPASPTAASGVTDSTAANPTIYQELGGASSVTTVRIGSSHYALVASNDGLQVVDVTDPVRPFNPLFPYVRLGLAGDRRATYTGLQDGGKTMAFEYLVGFGDWTTDLAYSGTDALSLGRNVLADAADSADFSGVGLPVPGSANSLSHNKDIILVSAGVTSDTPDGTYGPGVVVDIRVEFAEPVRLETFGIRADGNAGTFDVFDRVASVATTTIETGGAERHYALVASKFGNSLQIIDITNPVSPSAVAAITDNSTETPTAYTELYGAISVTTATIPVNGTDRHYALVASELDDGLQIIDITDPANPTAAAAITDNSTATPTAYTQLNGASSVTTTAIPSNGTVRHYALVASIDDSGLQIIDITDPANPTAAAAITDNSTATPTAYAELGGASSVTTTAIPSNGTVRHYALVASIDDSGLQIIDITNPVSPSAVAAITDNSTETPTAYTELDNAISVTTTTIPSNGTDRHYALVASELDDGLQIIDITNPASPSAVTAVTDCETGCTATDYAVLDSAQSVTTTTIPSNGTDRHYALVASFKDDGLQIIDITNPASPSAVTAVTDNSTANPTVYTELDAATSVTTATIPVNGADRHYALVTSFWDDGVQMIDITEPAHPFNPLLPYVGMDLAGDRRATYTGPQDGGKTMAFEYLVRPGDLTPDLAYSGTGALNFGRNVLADAVDSTDLSGVRLPVPGSANSLSHNKDIVLSDTTAFVTTWRTATGHDTITLPTWGSGMTVTWGDGQADTGVSAPVDHTYETAGDYAVRVVGGLEMFYLNGHDDAPKLIYINQWGRAPWTSMEDAFRGAGSMTYRAADAPDLLQVTDMDSMFAGATAFDGDISGWNVSRVANMGSMFAGATAFDGDISGWNVSRVANMGSMFAGATAFDGDISGWNVSRAANMTDMFRATAFDGNISGWNVSGVTDMGGMFRDATAFNQPIGSWDVSSVTGMESMFDGATSFQQNLGEWYVVLNDTGIARSDAPGTVGHISAQNRYLDAHSPTYGIGTGGDSGMFEIVNGSGLNMTSVDAKSSYMVNVTASGGTVFENGTNWRMVEVTVSGQPDTTLAADAGPDRQVNEEKSITLQGSGSDTAGAALTYSWSQLPPSPEVGFDNSTSPTPVITAPAVDANTDITLALRVSNGTAHVEDTMLLTIINTGNAPDVNTPPEADAGPDRTVAAGGNVTLQGSGSDEDGDDLTYSWSQDPRISYDNRTSAMPVVTVPGTASNGTITLTLTVSDGTAHDEDTMLLTIINAGNAPGVNTPPEADAGPDRTVAAGGNVTLQGSGSDEDGDDLTYSWSQDPRISYDNRTSAMPVVTVPGTASNGTITLTLTVSDGTAHDEDTMLLTIINAGNAPGVNTPPEADAGPDRTVAAGGNVTLQGSGSDEDGDDLTYSWSQDPGISYDNRTSAMPVVTVPEMAANGTITLTLTVSDGTAHDEDTMLLTILDVTAGNLGPVVDAGRNLTITERAAVTLSGSARDPNGDKMTYAWTQDSGPPVTLTNDDTVRPQFTAPGVTADDEIIFTFTATDAAGESADDTVTVTVLDVPITVSSATYSRSGTMTITFNQDIGGTDYSGLHVRAAGSDAGGITLSDVVDRPYSGRSITATLDTARQDEYDALQRPQLDVDEGAVTDLDGVGIAEMTDIAIRSAGSGKRSTAPPPAIDLGALSSRGVDIPPHIARMASERGESDPISPAAPDGIFDFPLVINGLGYLLDGPVNTMVPHAVTAGQNVTMVVGIYDQAPIEYFAIYLHLQDDQASHLQSDAQAIWDSGDVRVTDPGGLMRNVTLTVLEDPGDPARKAATLSATFSEGMGESNMVIRTWNTAGQIAVVRIFDAIAVTPPGVVDPEPGAVDPEPTAPPVVVDPEPVADPDSAGRSLLAIRMWSGFEPEPMTGAQLLAALGLDYPGAGIPGWMMTHLGVLVANGNVTVGEFVTALEYVLENS